MISRLHGLSYFVPETVLSNDDLVKFVDTNDAWIRERTGIGNRHRIGQDDETSILGFKAAEKCLEACAISGDKLTHIITATCTPDFLTPSVSCIVSGYLNAGPVMAFDIGAACAGFIYGLSVCNAFLTSAPDSVILFICAEALTRRLNWQDRSTCVLFGDAATACIISGKKQGELCELIDSICKSDGQQKNLISIGGGTSCQYNVGEQVGSEFFLAMQGRDTYKHAVRQMVNVCQEILKRNKLTIADVDCFVPHQANLRIIEAVGARLKINPDKVFTNVADYGNTSAASIPLALAEAIKCGQIRQGQKVLITAFGAGLTWGAALLQF